MTFLQSAYDRHYFRRTTIWTIAIAVAVGVTQFAIPCLAGEMPETAASSTPSLQDIVAQQTALRVQVVSKRGAFKDMHDGDRDRLLKQQDRLLLLLEGHRNFDELRAEERVEVFNHLQSVNAAATKAEDERQICERSRLVGTHRYGVVCMSGKEYREHKENARKSVRTIGKCQGDEQHSEVCNVR